MKRLICLTLTLALFGALTFHTAAAADISRLHQEAAAQKAFLNEDIVGWLQVPGTTIDLPIVQKEGDDNTYYFRRNLQEQFAFMGTPYLDYRCSVEPLGRNTVIYANSESDELDDALFGQLNRYRDPDLALEHPVLYFSDTRDTYAWRVVAATVSNIYVPYNHPDVDMMVVNQLIDESDVDFGGTVSESDKLLTLSTTWWGQAYPNDYRVVVLAKLEGKAAASVPAAENPETGRLSLY